MKKGQAIGLNTVIIAAIALVVLVIIVVLVAGSGRDVVDGLSSCSSQGGVCEPRFGGDVPQGYQPIEAKCATDGETCYALRQ